LSEGDRDRLADALARAGDADRKIDALTAKAEAADLAIGRAGALQRQLDEALTRLAWLEREQTARGREVRPPSEQSEAVASDRIAAAEDRARAAEDRLRDAEARITGAEHRAALAGDAEGRLRDTEARLADAEHRAALAAEAEDRARDAEARIAGAEARVADAEHRAEAAQVHGEDLAEQLAELQQRAARAEEAGRAGVESERRIASAEQRVAAAEQRNQLAEQRAEAAEGNAQALARQLADTQRAHAGEGNAQVQARQLVELQGQIAALEREVANADNVRSFAAETEREIAALQRDLRDTRTKLTQMTLERDRLESEVRDARGDDITSQRAAVKASFDPEVTMQADVVKYASLISKSAELEKKVVQLEREDAALRRQLAEAQERLRIAAIDLADDDDEDKTRTGSHLPIAELAEHVTTLEESINSLRANMRAASDETAMMDPSESVSTISSAVSQAAEHVEVARAAIRALSASIGIS